MYSQRVYCLMLLYLTKILIFKLFFPRQGICYGLTVYFKDNTDQSLPPVITITEDNSIPPEEGSDVLAYFGIKNPGQMIEWCKTDNDYIIILLSIQ